MAEKTITVTPDRLPPVARKLMKGLGDKLTDTNKLRADYAQDLLRQAQHNASRRPTPQAPAVARGMQVRGGAVLGFPHTLVSIGGRIQPMGGFSFGSEFGSSRFMQFSPRRGMGYWLNPSVDQVDDNSGVTWLDNIINDNLKAIN